MSAAGPASLMQKATVAVRVPATTANLGPGFDCLGLALDLWNSATFSIDPSAPAGQPTIEVQGEGAGRFTADTRNLVMQSCLRLWELAGAAPPPALVVHAQNRIPIGSGLGSSSAAILAGLLGANLLLGEPLSQVEILSLATEMEGHPDNVAPALLGGLVLASMIQGEGAVHPQPLVRKVSLPPWRAAVAVPEYELPTAASRAALPAQVAFQDAAFNLGRCALLVEALRSGDSELLEHAMQDRLHQPYRLPLIPGAAEAMLAAQEAGAAAAALSGAGPGIIALLPPHKKSYAHPVLAAMLAAFARAGVPTRGFDLGISDAGAAAWTAA